MTYLTRRPTGRPSRQKEIMDWLQEYINSGAGGMRSAIRVESDGHQRGYALRTLNRAKKALGFESIRIGGSEGDWMWCNPQRLVPDDKSKLQELSDKLDKHEQRLAEVAVTNKAQSLARIAGGWLQQITQDLFAQGKTLAQIRMEASKQDRYLNEKHFLDIENTFRQIAAEKLSGLRGDPAVAMAVGKATKAYQDTRQAIIKAVTEDNKNVDQAGAEMKAAEALMSEQIKSATAARNAAIEELSDQIGEKLYDELDSSDDELDSSE